MTFNVSSMFRPETYNHPVKNIELIETHISWVFLTGDIAYKIKKPVNFGFLDFSTLEKRRKCCEQEIDLNHRMAPDIYLDVVAISGPLNEPHISGAGTAIEYAVKMVQFPQSAQLDNRLTEGLLGVEHMDAVARMIAKFHQSIRVADDAVLFGASDTVYRPVEENFQQLHEHQETQAHTDTLKKLHQWCRSVFATLQTVFEQRKRDGFVRECHGDMHLRNLLWLESGPTAFDCIEFNPELRWIDVINEVAFLVMDLQDRQQHLLANRFLNAYLEATGDYSGLSVLPFYLCYRALVRAKVDVLRGEQENISAAEKHQKHVEFISYLDLATSYTTPQVAKLIIMRGVSASGKSTISRQLADVTGAIRIRSDVERKRLFDIASTDNASSAVDRGIYSPGVSQQTYANLLELAIQIIKAGYSVIVDAAFLKYEQRQPFQTVADRLGVAYNILDITVPAEVLRQRIMARKKDASDADLAVLDHQLSIRKPLHDNETDAAISIQGTDALDIESLVGSICSRWSE